MAGTEAKKASAKQSGNLHYSRVFAFVYLYVLSSNGERTKPCRWEEEGGEEGDWLRSHAPKGGELRRVVF